MDVLFAIAALSTILNDIVSIVTTIATYKRTQKNNHRIPEKD